MGQFYKFATPVKKVVSGGQTGVDRTALELAKAIGLDTGGWAPLGWRTDVGPDPTLAQFGLKQHHLANYQGRTLANVQMGDATLIFGNPESPGCKLTRRYCREEGKDCYVVSWRGGRPVPDEATAMKLRDWLNDLNVRTLNVAGNRLSMQPGIDKACAQFLFAVLVEGT